MPERGGVVFATHALELARYLQPTFVYIITSPDGAGTLLMNDNERDMRRPQVLVRLDETTFDVEPRPPGRQRHGTSRMLGPPLAVTCIVPTDEATAHAAQVTQLPFDGTVRKSFPQPPSLLPSERWWRLGCIIGPSGSGKSLSMRNMFGRPSEPKRAHRTVLEECDVLNDAAAARVRLRAAGLGALQWSRPYSTLSNGEQKAAELARSLVAFDDVNQQDVVVTVDEAFSYVDKATARVVAVRLAAFVHGRPSHHSSARLVLVGAAMSLDLLDILNPSWTFEPSQPGGEFLEYRSPPPALPFDHVPAAAGPSNALSARLVFARVTLRATIRRVQENRAMVLWQQNYEKYHYMPKKLNNNSKKHTYQTRDDESGKAISFLAYKPYVGRVKEPPPGEMAAKVWQEARLVVLPCFQGMGFGPKMSAAVAHSVCVARGPNGERQRYTSCTGNKALGDHRSANPQLWLELPHSRKLSQPGGSFKNMGGKTTGMQYIQYSHEYIGARAAAAARAAISSAAGPSLRGASALPPSEQQRLLSLRLAASPQPRSPDECGFVERNAWLAALHTQRMARAAAGAAPRVATGAGTGRRVEEPHEVIVISDDEAVAMDVDDGSDDDCLILVRFGPPTFYSFRSDKCSWPAAAQDEYYILE